MEGQENGGGFRHDEVGGDAGAGPEQGPYSPFDPRVQAPAESSAAKVSWIRSKLIWVAVGGVVVFAGIFGYAYIRRAVPFRVEGDRVIVRDSHGDAVEINTKPELPETFPADIPVYPESELQTSVELVENRDPEQEGSIYRWQAPGPLEDVAFWYEDELDLNGWDIALKQPAGNSGLV
ncbi:MAG TPA: hypothetical protein VD862_02630, partial [Candidatus Paceibacterota bacterium]|nr:hypothetical protein [Candidatus Paceibacterota bacterium]